MSSPAETSDAARPTDEARRSVVLALVERCPYRRGLRPMRDDVARVALANDQLRAAIDAMLADAGPDGAGRIDDPRFRRQRRLIEHMLEWVYFASDDFVERARRG